MVDHTFFLRRIKMARITVIGSFVMDNIAKMDSFPSVGQSVVGKSIELFPGGKGANQCVAIKRLRGDVAMCGMLGDDANGRTFLRLFEEEGISAENIFTCEAPTGIAQIQIDASGQNRICVIPSANFQFSFEHIEKIDGVIKNTDMIVLQLELTLPVTEELVRRAKRYNKTVILNPAPAAPLSPEVLGMADILTPNETELSLLTGGLPVETDGEIYKAADVLLSFGCKTVIATLGSRGALIATKDKKEIVSGYKVKAVDTVAAGDSFNGALAVALCEGKDMAAAVSFANAVGALTVTKNGAIPSLPTREEVEEFIAKR